MKAKLIKALLVFGKTVSPKAGQVTLVDISDDEYDRLESMGKVAKPTSDDLKIGVLVEVPKTAAKTSTTAAATTASTSTSTANGNGGKADNEPVVKAFDKMTKAELDKALIDAKFDAPENWATLKNFDKATFLQTETDKAKAAADAAIASAEQNNGGGSDDDLNI